MAAIAALAVVVIVRDVLYRRLLALRSALVGFRAGRRDTRAEVKGPRELQEIAAEFSTALLRGLIRDEAVRAESPLGLRTEIGIAGRHSR